MEMAERFWAKVRKSDDCWTWTAGRNRKGYGQFFTGGAIRIGAHRVAWELENGPIPPGLVVMHLCDNPSCVRPNHLAIGRQSANIADSYRKGRQSRYNAAKTHCPRGHAYDDANTYHHDGRRICRLCNRRRRQEHEARRRANRVGSVDVGAGSAVRR